MRSRRAVWFLSFLLVGFVVFCLFYRRVVHAPGAVPRARVVRFPTDYSLGTLYTRTWDAMEESWKKLGEASGPVAVPAGRELMLKFWPASRRHTSTWRAFLKKIGFNVSETVIARGRMADLKALRSTDLQALTFGRTPVFGRDLKCLKRMDSLHTLDLRSRNITDEDLKRLQKLKSLRWLGLRGTWITDAGLAHLKELPLLETLDLSWNEIHGPGLAHLKAMPSLRNLNLQGTDMNDEGIQYLAELTGLRRMDVFATKISAAGLARLEKALPGCEITMSLTIYDRPPWQQLPW